MIFDMPTCGGCRTCEIACSYHHLRAFAPSVSSIKILNKVDGIGYSVLFLEEDGESGRTCDGCSGLEIPYCVEVCKDAEELKKMLEQLPQVKSRAGLRQHGAVGV
jgi:Fe-S-cluster-containing hydrogenase component 2